MKVAPGRAGKRGDARLATTAAQGRLRAALAKLGVAAGLADTVLGSKGSTQAKCGRARWVLAAPAEVAGVAAVRLGGARKAWPW